MLPAIPAIAAMIASTAIQMNESRRAASRQQAALREARGRQMAMQDQATQAAARRALEFDPQTRNERQQDIQQEMTGQLQQQVAQPQITAQGVAVGSTMPDGEGGTDYLKAKARETAKSTESLRALAALMGRTGSAGELRRREAVGFGDTVGDINRIKTGANNIWEADQAGVQAAGQPSLGAGIASAALSAYGMSSLAGAGMGDGAIAGTNTGGAAARANPMGWWLMNGRGGD